MNQFSMEAFFGSYESISIIIKIAIIFRDLLA